MEDTGVDWRIVLRRIFRKWMWGRVLDRAGSGQGEMAGKCESGNEPSGSIKYGDFLD